MQCMPLPVLPEGLLALTGFVLVAIPAMRMAVVYFPLLAEAILFQTWFLVLTRENKISSLLPVLPAALLFVCWAVPAVLDCVTDFFYWAVYQVLLIPAALSALSAAWTGFCMGVRAALSQLGQLLAQLWESALVPAFWWLANRLSDVLDAVWEKISTAVQRAFARLWSAFVRKAIVPVRARISAGVRAARARLVLAVFTGIPAAAKSHWFAARTVLRGLRLACPRVSPSLGAGVSWLRAAPGVLCLSASGLLQSDLPDLCFFLASAVASVAVLGRAVKTSVLRRVAAFWGAVSDLAAVSSRYTSRTVATTSRRTRTVCAAISQTTAQKSQNAYAAMFRTASKTTAAMLLTIRAAHTELHLSIKAVARVIQIATISPKAFFTMHPSTLPFGFPVDVPKFEGVMRILCFAQTRRSAIIAMAMVRNNSEEAIKRAIADPKLAYINDGTVVFSKNTEEQTIDTHPLIATTPEPTGTISNPITPAFHWSAASFIPATVFNPQDPYVLQSLYDARDKERTTTPSESDNDNAPERVSTTEVPSGDYNSTVDRPTEDIPPTIPDSATIILATENITTTSAARGDDDSQPAQDDADTTLVSVPSYSDKSHAAPSAFVLGDVSDDSDSFSSPPSYASDDSSLAFDDDSDADGVQAFKDGLRAAADADGAIDALVRDLAGLTVHDMEETIACDYAEAKTAGAFSVVITIDPASASESEAEFEADNEAETDEGAETGGAEEKYRRPPPRVPISVSFQSYLPHPSAYSARGSGSDSGESGYDSSECESSYYAPDRTRLCLPELPPHLARNPFEFEAPPRGGEAGRAPTFAALMARPRKFKKSRRAGRKITARKNRLRAAGEFAVLAALADVDVPWAEDVPLPEDAPGDWDEDGAEGDAEAVCKTVLAAVAVAGEVQDA